MKRLLAAIVIIHLALLTALIGLRFLGSRATPESHSFTAQLVHDSVLGNSGWCWRYVCPGATTDTVLNEKIALWSDIKVVRDGNVGMTLTTFHLESVSTPRWTIILLIRQPSRHVQRIQIQPEMNAITIGELMLSIGTPITRRADFAYGLWTTVFCFEARLCAGMIDNERNITYWSKVDFLEYAVLDRQLNERLARITRPWHGFTSPQHP